MVEAELPPADDGALSRFLCFQVGSERCAFALGTVEEVVRVSRIYDLPLSPPAIEGLANLHGRVLPVLDAGRALGFLQAARGSKARIVVVRAPNRYGLLVDAIEGVIDVAAQASLGSALDADGRLFTLIDPAELLARECAGIASSAAAPAVPADADRQEESGDDEDEDESRYLAFTVAGQEFALPIAAVRETARLPKTVAAVPHGGAHLLGVASLRGGLLPLADLRLLLGLPAPATASARQRVLVIDTRTPVGLIVDGVSEVLGNDEPPLPLPPLWERTASKADLEAVFCLDDGGRLVSLLNFDHLREAVLVNLPIEEPPMPADTSGEALAEEDGETLVVFALGEQEFAFPVAAVREILRVPKEFARVPGAEQSIQGMINLRGKVLPVHDQRLRLGIAAAVRSRSERVLVIESAGESAGFAVDAVREVITVPRESLCATPSLAPEQARLVRQMVNLDGGRLILLLDPGEMLRGAASSGVRNEPG